MNIIPTGQVKITLTEFGIHFSLNSLVADEAKFNYIGIKK